MWIPAITYPVVSIPSTREKGTYNIENRRATFLESKEAARLYFLHLLLGMSCTFSATDLSVNLQHYEN